MKTSSAKAKGRRCSSEVRDLLLKYAPELEPDDVRVTPSGVTGEDVQLSPRARRRYPFATECKNTESISVWAAYEQAESHKVNEGQVPILFFRRNRSQLMVALTAEHFMQLTQVSRKEGEQT